MEYEWDRDKADKNVRKHDVDFADAVTALEDDNALTVEDQDPEEERFITVGMDALGRLLVVTYTWRGEHVRLISARKATRRERNQYEGKNQ
ncbi:MAG: BrnT family toxin [Thermodesulfobacteriota bacterium]